MYSPSHFQEDRPEIIRDLIDRFPLATIVYQSDKVLCAEHVPLILDPSFNPAVRMLGHVARGNGLWRIRPDEEVLVIFQGPSLYVSPNWYATKTDGGKVVPTWNYVVVHATCRLRAIQDPDRLLQIVTAMTDQMEATQRQPWKVTDAPPSYIERMIAAIVGIELDVIKWHGKWKVSQNQPEANQLSLVSQLLSDGSERAQEMADMISRFGGA
jgi:transcriptional regulator